MGISLVTKDFYAMPVTAPFLLAALVALFINRKVSLDKKLDVFCKGAGEPNIILMCLIFILAGAFAEVAKTMRAVESTVNLGLTFLPSNILVAGVFIIATLVSLVDICTANNTIAIVTVGPMAKDISDQYDIEPKRVAGILDMFSCASQGIIHYGAQLLSASALAKLSPFIIMRYLYYPYLMGISALMAIVFIPYLKLKIKQKL